MKDSSKVVVIGGASGIGLELARAVLAEGAHVVIAGRSEERLRAVATSLGDKRVQVSVLDIGDCSRVIDFFKEVGQFDHLVITAADLPYGPAVDLDEGALMRAIRSKLLGPFFAAKASASRIRPGGSITFTSGIAAKRPARGGAAAATVNAGLEGMARALALELAPVRVNVASPGWTDTPIWDRMPGMTLNRKQEIFSSMAARLPAGRVGRPQDIAQAILFLMKSQFTTATVLDVDGGHRLV